MRGTGETNGNFGSGSVSISKSRDILQGPNRVSDTRLHCRGHPKRLMNPHEVVIHEVERQGVLQVLHLLRERIGQAREPPHAHPHIQILSLHIRCAHMLGVRIALNPCSIRSVASAWAVSGFPFRPWVRSINLDQLGIIDVGPERILNGFQMRLVPVRGQLNAIRQTVARMLFPSTREARTCFLLSIDSLFMLTKIHERS